MLFDVSKEKRTCLLLLLIQSLPQEDSSLGVVIPVQKFQVLNIRKAVGIIISPLEGYKKNKHKLAKRAALHFL